jgi:hypothetical protein
MGIKSIQMVYLMPKLKDGLPNAVSSFIYIYIYIYMYI